MPKVIIIEPTITLKENERIWERTEEIINLIIDDLRKNGDIKSIASE